MNCKQGDLAVQIECRFYRANIGSFYRVADRCSCHYGAWVCDPAQQVVENIGLMDMRGRKCDPGNHCCVWDHELRPIRPGAAVKPKETTKEKEYGST